MKGCPARRGDAPSDNRFTSRLAPSRPADARETRRPSAPEDTPGGPAPLLPGAAVDAGRGRGPGRLCGLALSGRPADPPAAPGSVRAGALRRAAPARPPGAHSLGPAVHGYMSRRACRPPRSEGRAAPAPPGRRCSERRRRRRAHAGGAPGASPPPCPPARPPERLCDSSSRARRRPRVRRPPPPPPPRLGPLGSGARAARRGGCTFRQPGSRRAGRGRAGARGRPHLGARAAAAAGEGGARGVAGERGPGTLVQRGRPSQRRQVPVRPPARPSWPPRGCGPGSARGVRAAAPGSKVPEKAARLAESSTACAHGIGAVNNW